MTINELCSELGYKAKELVIGMRKRVGRDPDMADYAAAFAPLLGSFGLIESSGEVFKVTVARDGECFHGKHKGDLCYKCDPKSGYPLI